MLFKPTHIKPDEKQDTTLNRGRGDCRLFKFKGFVASVPRLLKPIVWKAMKSIFNLFELPSVLEYQFCENRVAFSITYLLNCIGVYNAFMLCLLWPISLKCNLIQQTELYIINELINGCDMWGGKYAVRLNLLYMEGIKRIYLVNYRPRLLLNKMQG
jgi:hypothetical protein